jgi:hypothetical protein
MTGLLALAGSAGCAPTGGAIIIVPLKRAPPGFRSRAPKS